MDNGALQPPPGSVILKCKAPFQHISWQCIEGTLGVPKNLSHLIFVHALRVFHSILYDKVTELPSLTRFDEAFSSTLVILSTVVEHLPAINMRKQILDFYYRSNKPKFKIYAQRELHWLAILFKSKMPKHNKSPMLWHHRKWIIGLLYPGGALTDGPFEKEMEIIFAAGDVHRCNYYSWNYARWLFGINVFYGDGNVSHQLEPIIYKKVLAFCTTHVSDISCWTFLLNYLLAIPKSLDLILTDNDSNEKQMTRYRADATLMSYAADGTRLSHRLRDAIQSAEKIAKVAPGHAAVEYFIKTANKFLESKPYMTMRVDFGGDEDEYDENYEYGYFS